MGSDQETPSEPFSDPDFVAQRMDGLQTYIQALLQHSGFINKSQVLKSFLCPQTFTQDFESKSKLRYQSKSVKGFKSQEPNGFIYQFFKGTNTQNVSLWFRGSVTYEVGTAFPSMGWRLKKDFFKVSTPNWFVICTPIIRVKRAQWNI